MSASVPRMLARWALRLVGAVERQQPGAREQILTALPEDIAALYGEPSTAGRFIPLAEHMTMVRAAAAAVGVATLDEVQRGNFATGFGRSTLSRLIIPGIRLFGAGGRALRRLVPRVYGHITRDCGSLRVEFPDVGSGVLLTMDGVPLCARIDDLYPRAFANAMHACLDLVEADGGVEMDTSKLGLGHVEFKVTVRDAEELAQRRHVV